MTDSFQKALEFVLQWEGGYVNDPSDPGGETKYGISKRAHPSVDIKNLTKEKAAEIYKRHYWIALECDALPSALAVAVFDSAVNCGAGRAVSWLKESKNAEELLAKRAMHYYTIAKSNKKLRKFVGGWFNRLYSLHDWLPELEKFLKETNSSKQ